MFILLSIQLLSVPGLHRLTAWRSLKNTPGGRAKLILVLCCFLISACGQVSRGSAGEAEAPNPHLTPYEGTVPSIERPTPPEAVSVPVTLPPDVVPASKPASFRSLVHLVSLTHVIIVGRVIRVDPMAMHSEVRGPVTISDVMVEEVLKGNPPRPLVQVLKRGQPDVEYRLPGSVPRYLQENERLLLFLSEIQGSVYLPGPVYSLTNQDQVLAYQSAERGSQPEQFTLAELRNRVPQTPDLAPPLPGPQPSPKAK